MTSRIFFFDLKDAKVKCKKLTKQIVLQKIAEVRNLTLLTDLLCSLTDFDCSEQWTGNPEVGGSSPPSNHLVFGCLRNSY